MQGRVGDVVGKDGRSRRHMSATRKNDDEADDIQTTDDAQSVSATGDRLNPSLHQASNNYDQRLKSPDSERSSQLEVQLARTKNLLDAANKRLAAYHRSPYHGKFFI